VSALLFAGIAAVACYVLAFAPADLGPLAFVALAPWCLLARRMRGVRLFGFATLTGAALLTFGCFWIRRTDPVNLALMVLPESLGFGVFALLLRALLVTRALPAALALPLAFTSVEFIRDRWPLDGFPWLSLGYSQHRFLLFAQVADLGGVHLVTLLLGLVAGSVADAAARRGARARTLALAPGICCLALACGYGALRRAHAPETQPGPGILLVQPDIEQRLKNENTQNADQILRMHLRLAAAARATSPIPVDLVAFSETMLPGLAESPDAGALERERREIGLPLVQAVKAPLLAGCATLDGEFGRPGTHVWNSAILFDRDGRRAAQYSKRVLVPGGEYLPWIDAFPTSLQQAIRRAVYEGAGFVNELTPGRRSGLVDIPCGAGSVRAGLTICFEIAYPHLGRALVGGGAELLINLSNEAWFPDTAEFEQYVAMAVLRALETRRAVVKVANSGASGWIGPDGVCNLFERDGRRDGFPASAVVAPPRCREITLYVRSGEWAGAGACLVLLALIVLRRRGGRGRPVAVASATA